MTRDTGPRWLTRHPVFVLFLGNVVLATTLLACMSIWVGNIAGGFMVPYMLLLGLPWSVVFARPQLLDPIPGVLLSQIASWAVVIGPAWLNVLVGVLVLSRVDRDRSRRQRL